MVDASSRFHAVGVSCGKSIISQRSPLWPAAQSHSKSGFDLPLGRVPGIMMHVPPLRHGLLEHGSTVVVGVEVGVELGVVDVVGVVDGLDVGDVEGDVDGVLVALDVPVVDGVVDVVSDVVADVDGEVVKLVVGEVVGVVDVV